MKSTTRRTGGANLLPLAYGSVTSGGALNANSTNVSINKTGTGTFEVTITGESYNNTGYVTMATLLGSSGGGISVTAGGGGVLLVSTFNSSNVLTDRGFTFIVFKP